MINAYAFVLGTTSWAHHARGFFHALDPLEPVALVALDTPQNGSPHTPAFQSMLQRTPDAASPSIGLGPIEAMPDVKGLLRVGYIVWETTVMPQDKLKILNSMDVVWVPTHWGRSVLIDNGIPANKVHVVPEGVDANLFAPIERAPQCRFRFLCVGKWEERKGIVALIESFLAEFSSEEEVELVLHCYNPYVYHFSLENEILRKAGNRSSQILASSPTGQQEMVQLYNSADAFVLPTRAEGWGLPILEAMSCGLPVIVTNYSGPTDYLTEQIAYPIPIEKLVHVYDPVFFADGAALGEWAQPDLSALKTLMRHVYENRAEAKRKGNLARAAVLAQWTWHHAALKALASIRREGI